MTVNWADGVNQKIRRSGGSWERSDGFIESQTRSGKTKRRLANTQAYDTYNVAMLFTLEEYRLFDYWFENTTRRGFHSFWFPSVDGKTTENEKYRFAQDGSPKYSNPSGDMVAVTMVWEKVK